MPETLIQDNKPDLRFVAWIKAGTVPLQRGANKIRFRMDSANSHHGSLDCFVLSTEPFQPQGTLKPDQLAAAARQIAVENAGWFAFTPGRHPFRADSGFDLRPLNENFAGENGFITVQGPHFAHGDTGRPLRFWAVNGPPQSLKDRQALRDLARLLAKYGVNLVRLHGGYFDEHGEVQPESVRHAIDVVECMKAEGIYSHFSMTPSPATGKPLIAEPAVAGCEIVNEDSYFFWTFTADNVPDPQLRILEQQFGDWAAARYGSLDKALEAWRGLNTPRDAAAEGRLGFRPLWNMFHERRPRDQDTARFLLESQRQFYQETYGYLRELGFRGAITCSNWTTASPQVFGPLEKYSYTVGDFIDRHGYFGCNLRGESSEWSVREGHTYGDRSALRFEAEQPGQPKAFNHPVMDPHYDGKPSMISETTFCRPNRYRSEAPLYYAAYGSLQNSNAIVHFALDSPTWAVKPGFFMQPWTLMTPAMLGQFPAAALIYRTGLVPYGELLVDLNLKLDELLDLQGTPLPQDAAFDELRLKDVPSGIELKPGNVIDPLVHYAGRSNVRFSGVGGPPLLKDLGPYIDRGQQTVTSTTGHLRLDYRRGLLTINAPAAQGVSGALSEAGTTDLADVTISSDLPLGHVIAASLDGQGLSTSRRMLLQVMSEEKAAGFRTERVSEGVQRIVSIGQDPWLVREFRGTVQFKRPDAARLTVTALDFNGYPAEPAGTAERIALRATTLYYLIQEAPPASGQP